MRTLSLRQAGLTDPVDIKNFFMFCERFGFIFTRFTFKNLVGFYCNRYDVYYNKETKMFGSSNLYGEYTLEEISGILYTLNDLEGIENVSFKSSKHKSDCESFYKDFGHLFSVSQSFMYNHFIVFDSFQNTKRLNEMMTVLYDMKIGKFVSAGLFSREYSLAGITKFLKKRFS